MPKRNLQIANGEFYHIVKRGIEERNIFLDQEDRYRFLNSVLVFNDKAPVPWMSRAFWHQRDPATLLTTGYIPQLPLVEIHAFALMTNHFHLLVRQIMDNGIATLMQKLGGYSYYFNKKNNRTGTLFQDRYRTVLIKTEEQLKNTFNYIHTNPISLIESEWKKGIIGDVGHADNFLRKEYAWSSYRDYLGESNFPTLVHTDFFMNLYGNKEAIKEDTDSWIKYKINIESELSTSPGLVDEYLIE
ncbi:MAG: transposase [bacterium]